MADLKTFTNEETIGLIKAKAGDAQHGDNFLVKIHRRGIGSVAGFGGRGELVTSLGGATVEHICNSEVWLPKLVGGGQFIMKVYSEQDAGKQMGGDLALTFQGEAKPFDPNTLRSAGWLGPRELKYPETAMQVSPPFVALGSPNMFTGQQMQQGLPQQHLTSTILPTGPSQAELELKQQIAQMQVMLQQANTAAAQRDRELAEERAARREEQLRREHASAIGELKGEIAKIANAAPAKNPVELITALGATIMPLVQSMIAGNNESRQLMAKIQADSNMQFQTLMMKSMERPAVSPEVTALMDRFQGQLEKLREADPAQGNMVSQMADAFGGMTSMMVNVMGQVADSGLLGGKQESMGMTIVKELAKAVEAFGRASTNVKPSRPRLPPPRQMPAAATAIGPQQPIVTAPAPNGNGNGATAPAGFAGVATVMSQINPLDEIERRIRAEEDPAKIAVDFIAVINHPLVQAEIAAAGDLAKAFGARLGDAWGVEHMEYAQALLSEVQQRAVDAGLLVEEDEADEQEAE